MWKFRDDAQINCKLGSLLELMPGENCYFTSRTLFIKVFSVYLEKGKGQNVMHHYHSVLLYNFIFGIETLPISYLNLEIEILFQLFRLYEII